MPKFVRERLSRMNRYRVYSYLPTPGNSLYIPVQLSERHAPDIERGERRVCVPLRQFYGRQFVAFGLGQGKDTFDGLEADHAFFNLFMLVLLLHENRADDFFGFAALAYSIPSSHRGYRLCHPLQAEVNLVQVRIVVEPGIRLTE